MEAMRERIIGAVSPYVEIESPDLVEVGCRVGRGPAASPHLPGLPGCMPALCGVHDAFDAMYPA